MNSLYQTNLSFTSQNYGGRKYSRLNRITCTCLGVVVAVGLILGLSAYTAGDFLLGIYSSDPEVVQFGLNRLAVFGGTYFIGGMMDVMVGAIRGIGYSVLPMCVSLIGVCAMRILWIYTIFQWSHSLQTLYISYPVTWIITVTAHIICYILIRKKLPKKDFE